MAIRFLNGQTIDGALTVSGNVQGATFNGLAINTSLTNNVANQIVRTQGNGYVNFGWINSISGNHTGTITRITASNDQYLRYVTPAQFRVGVTDGYYAPVSTVTGVTSVATGNGLTGGTIISTGTLTMSGSYTGKFTIDSTGDVEYLALNTTATTNKRVRIQFTQNDNAGMEIGTDYGVDNSSNFYFYDRVAGSTMLFTSVASSYFPGKLAVGMASTPNAQLHVSANGSAAHGSSTGIDVAAGAGGGNVIALDAADNHNWLPYTNGDNYYSSNNHLFRSGTGNSPYYMTINTSGNVGIGLGSGFASQKLQVTGNTIISGSVGIGNTSPGTKLHVNGSNLFVKFENTSSTANHYTQMLLQAGSAQNYIWTANQNSTNWGGPNSLNIYTQQAGAIAFFTSGSNKRMTIAAGGNVGIGTDSPDAQLEVVYGGGYNVGMKVRSTSGYAVMTLEAPASNYPILEFKEAGTQKWQVFNEPANDSLNFYAWGASAGTRLIILQSGNVGIGTTSPDYQLDIENSSHAVVRIHAGVNSSASLRLKNDAQDWDLNTQTNDTFAIYNQTTGTQPFSILPNGNVGIGITSPTAKIHVVGTASVPAARLYGTGGTIPPLQLRQDNTAGWFTKFYSDNFGTYIGGISFYGSTTTFNTSSDYRLKENIIPISDSITRLKQLKPSRFNFKQYPEITIDGFLAHEVQDIVPEAVTGDKDELDLSGKPVYQAIDHSRLIPLLVASIQELEARVKELENK